MITAGPYVYVGTTISPTNRLGIATGYIHFVKLRRRDRALGRLVALYVLWKAVV